VPAARGRRPRGQLGRGHPGGQPCRQPRGQQLGVPPHRPLGRAAAQDAGAGGAEEDPGRRVPVPGAAAHGYAALLPLPLGRHLREAAGRTNPRLGFLHWG
ncbi:unnamed protein product, partial [Polarella glacialis]